VKKLVELLGMLPPSHYATLKCLFEFLVRVDSHNAQNLMDYKNLSRIFGPIVIRREVEKISEKPGLISKSILDDIATVGLICEVLIANQKAVFGAVDKARGIAASSTSKKDKKEKKEKKERKESSGGEKHMEKEKKKKKKEKGETPNGEHSKKKKKNNNTRNGTTHCTDEEVEEDGKAGGQSGVKEELTDEEVERLLEQKRKELAQKKAELLKNLKDDYNDSEEDAVSPKKRTPRKEGGKSKKKDKNG